MNKKVKLIPYLFSAGLVTGALFLGSCDSDDPAVSIQPEVEIPTEFSDLTPEQNKQNVQESGVALVAKMDNLRQEQGVKTSIALTHFLDVAELPDGRVAQSNQVIKMMKLLAQFSRGEKKAQDVLKGLRSKEDEDPSSPKELFDDLKGTYTYSTANNEWSFTEGGDKIIFKFPSTKNGANNNAEFSIYGLQTVTVNNTELEYSEDVPTALKADLTVSGQKVIEYNLTASYKGNGEPTAVNTSLTIGSFKLVFDLQNTTSEVAVEYALTHNGSNLISLGAGAKGNFTTTVGEDAEAEDVIQSGGAFFQVMNIRFAGNVDVAKLAPAINNANTLAAEAAAFNQHIDFVVFYADNKKKIADTEFYVANKVDTYESCDYWNGEEYECETIEESYQAVDIRLVYEDGSPVDLETYTDIGFEELESEIEDLLDALEADLD